MKSGSIILLISVVFLSGCTLYGEQPTTTAPPTQPSVPQETTSVVEITSSGFDPKSLTINAGDTVAWTNVDSALHWPASAVHPTHTIYPEGGGCIGSKFDACRGLEQGDSWSFTFTHSGTWKYHDHLNPSSTGEIVVE